MSILQSLLFELFSTLYTHTAKSPFMLIADTMGSAFAFPIARFLGPELAIGAYVHYPTISSDMVDRVRQGRAGVENGGVSGSRLKTRLKLM